MTPTPSIENKNICSSPSWNALLDELLGDIELEVASLTPVMFPIE